MHTVFALLPIVLILVLMLGPRFSAARAGSVGFLLTAALAQFVFGFGTHDAAQAWIGLGAETLFMAATILWIVVPALALHELQQTTSAMVDLRAALANLTGDRRLSVLFVAWFFALFLEGAAGFGTPVALAAPLLVGLGFPAAQAVTLALLGHAVGVSFGAVGIPMLTLLQIAAGRVDPIGVTTTTAALHAILCGLLVGSVLLAARDNTRPAPPTRILPWAALAACLFAVPSLLFARLVGPELPTLGGGLVGGVVFALVLHLRRPRRDRALPPPPVPLVRGRLARAAAPYLVLLFAVLATRLLPFLRDSLEGLRWHWQLAGGYTGSVAPLSHPGTLLVLALVVGAGIQKVRVPEFCAAAARAGRRLPAVALALVSMLAVARLMVHSGMIATLATQAAATFGTGWPMIAPWVGVLGTFVTGSATASSILFVDFQLATAQSLSLPTVALSAAHSLGAAVGNVICPHNIVGGCATVGLVGQEGRILRQTSPACTLYTLLGGALVTLVIRLNWH